MILRLLAMRCLDRYRIQGTLPVAIDGTGTHTFATRHCPYCLTQKHGDVTVYYHMVVEAKIVTPDGLALSLGTEFVENRPGQLTQDDETKAFHRLALRLKAAYPRVAICLLLDSGYAEAPVLDRCRELGWQCVIVLKEGSMPERVAEYRRLQRLSPENQQREIKPDGAIQDFTWISELPIELHRVAILECVETRRENKPSHWMWITTLGVTKSNASTIAAKAGRQRWKIENQGFNTQKCLGFRMEHAYSRHETGGKNFYLLLQIAHLIDQMLDHGSLLVDRVASYGSKRAFAARLLEAIRTVHFPADTMDVTAAAAIQIRLRCAAG